LTTQAARDTKQKQDLDLIYAISDIQKFVSRMMVKETIKENLTLQQSAVLRIIANSGPIQMNRIGRELLTTAANITSLIDRLEKKGLVQRTENKADRRKIEIQLTPDGKKIFETAAARYRENIQESFDLLTSAEKKDLLRLLIKLSDEISRREIDEKELTKSRC